MLCYEYKFSECLAPPAQNTNGRLSGDGSNVKIFILDINILRSPCKHFGRLRVGLLRYCPRPSLIFAVMVVNCFRVSAEV